MNRIQRLLAVVILSGCASAGAPGSEAEVRVAESRRFAAMVANDAAALSPMLAEDLVYVHSGGQIENKEQFLQRLAGQSLRYRSIRPSEQRVHISGPLAVISGRSEMAVELNQTPQTLNVRYTAVYRRAPDGRWQLVSWQTTKLPQ